jgi:hypothetical protein
VREAASKASEKASPSPRREAVSMVDMSLTMAATINDPVAAHKARREKGYSRR